MLDVDLIQKTNHKFLFIVFNLMHKTINDTDRMSFKSYLLVYSQFIQLSLYPCLSQNAWV